MTFDEQDLAAQTSLRQLKKDIQTAEPATLRLLLTAVSYTHLTLPTIYSV